MLSLLEVLFPKRYQSQMSIFKKRILVIVLFLIGIIAFFLRIEKKSEDSFYIKEFLNYKDCLYRNDSLVLEKKFLINNPYKYLIFLKDTLILWSSLNYLDQLSNNDKSKVLLYKFYRHRSQGFFTDEINEYYKEDSGFWSKSFGDKSNPLYVEIEWKFYKDKNRIRKIISLLGDSERIELSREYFNKKK